MEFVNAVEVNGVLYFMERKPTGTVLEAVIKYDSRFEDVDVLVGDRLAEVKHALTVRSTASCNYRLIEE